MTDTVPESSAEPSPAPAPVAEESKGAALWREIKGLFWVLVAVLLFHSFIAKPFYIPSESMMPILLKGDRLVVSKYPYGWSWVSPSFHVFPHWSGRVMGRMPERGDIVIVTPPGGSDDWIKRVIGLPGDTIEVRGGRLIINGKPVKSVPRPPVMVPVDANVPCGMEFSGFQTIGEDGKAYCRLPIVRETLPNGVTYDTIDLGPGSAGDDRPPVKVPANHLFLMGDDRDRSADSRFTHEQQGLGGPVPWENIGGRAEFITFSLDGTSQLLNPLSWFEALRSGRAGTSLRAQKE
ncbi:signal peptidase I [Sphingomonas daechungensis]|uniref:Signal peptidase I n=1 Tax=Sphingomonas daechungensis TaxID=1176646 RepID=A0ABX6T2W6_9SPHN|nr:signal peptidase I [Sphingomonas daechungensis]